MSPALQRLARLLALVPYLLARPGAPLAEVAGAFGISEDRLIDDLELLFVCGLPGHMPDDLIEATFDGGVVHIDNADTIARPLRLGTDEAVALLSGLRMLARLPGAADHEALDRALAKLERAAGDAAAATERIAVVAQGQAEVLAAARVALRESRALRLQYYVPGRDELTDRVVDPMRLLLLDSGAYLEAWCRLAEGVRLFRADRVHSIELLDTPAAVPAQARYRDLDEGLFQPAPQDRAVVLDLADSARWVAEHYPCERVEQQDGGLRVTLRTADSGWVVRLVLRLGAAARVLAPAEVAEEVTSRAQAALAAYQ